MDDHEDVNCTLEIKGDPFEVVTIHFEDFAIGKWLFRILHMPSTLPWNNPVSSRLTSRSTGSLDHQAINVVVGISPY